MNLVAIDDLIFLTISAYLYSCLVLLYYSLCSTEEESKYRFLLSGTIIFDYLEFKPLDWPLVGPFCVCLAFWSAAFWFSTSLASLKRAFLLWLASFFYLRAFKKMIKLTESTVNSNFKVGYNTNFPVFVCRPTQVRTSCLAFMLTLCIWKKPEAPYNFPPGFMILKKGFSFISLRETGSWIYSLLPGVS